MVPLFALLLVAGCSTEPTDDLRNGTARIDAAPSQLFIELGATKTVDVSAVDDQGNQISSAYEVTATGSGITVKRDSTFLPIFINDSTLSVPPEAPVFRFIVTATAYTSTSFTVSNGEKEVVIPVQVIPQNQIAVTFSSTTPALGDTVTVAAPAGTSFAQTSEVTIAGGALQPLIVYRSATNDTIRFIPPPNVNAALTISEVTSASAPSLTFTPVTSQILTTPLFDSLDVSFDNAVPNVGQTVTVTLPSPLIKFQPTSTIVFPAELANPANITVSADSNTLTFEAPPNATGAGRIDSIIFPGGFALSLPTRPTITAENIGTTVAATFDNANPNVNQVVTLTAPGGFSFDPAATILISDVAPFVVSQSTSQIQFVPSPGQTGPATVGGVILNTATQFNLTLNTADTLHTSSTVPSLGGTGDSASAPTLTNPGPGASNTFFDAGTFPGDFFGVGAPVDLIYKLTIPAGGMSLTLNWSNGSDVDIILCDDGCGTVVDVEGATGDQPETTTFTGVPAGTYYLVIDLFAGGAPAWVNLTLTRP